MSDRVEQLSKERDDLLRRLRELEQGIQMDRATRRAALNLMEDAMEAHRAAQRDLIKPANIDVLEALLISLKPARKSD